MMVLYWKMKKDLKIVFQAWSDICKTWGQVTKYTMQLLFGSIFCSSDQSRSSYEELYNNAAPNFACRGSCSKRIQTENRNLLNSLVVWYFVDYYTNASFHFAKLLISVSREKSK